MLFKIKNNLEREIRRYVAAIEKNRAFSRISPLLFRCIKDFICRPGKRVRPTLLVIGYRGFSRKNPAGLYKSALSIELLHDFMLVHDDIIDKSDTRRGRPSVHKMLNNFLKGNKHLKFNGQDLAIVVGDVLYALGLDAFLSINEEPLRKENALKQLIRAALFTGSGEFIELLYGLKALPGLSKEDIYKIYDYKTAYYTFSSPLAIGAILAGAKEKEIARLIQYGIYLGRAFQIKDDILGMFAEEEKTGKSALADLKEAKKTILIWYAYNHTGAASKKLMQKILDKERAGKHDLLAMRRIICESRALDYAGKQVSTYLNTAKKILQNSRMRPEYKVGLELYCRQLLKL